MPNYAISNRVIIQKNSLFASLLLDKFDYASVLKAFGKDDIVMMLGVNGELYNLNLLGSLILEHICREGNTKELVMSLSSVFDKEETVLEKDTQEFVQDLIEVGVIFQTAPNGA